MGCSFCKPLIGALALLGSILAGAAGRPAWAADIQPPPANNRGVVELETGPSPGISVRMAEDLASVVDDGATRRVLPVLGQGSLQNVTDLQLLRGVDITIIQQDLLEYARQQKLYPGIENWASYIAKLYNEEFHLLARPEIKTVADLANRRVNVDLNRGGTAVTADRLFHLLGIPVVVTNDSQEVALERLQRGEIAALAFVGGKPAPLFRGLKASGGLHFLSIPTDPRTIEAYVPTQLTAADYPDLVPQDQPVDTVAVGTVLMAANLQPRSDRYRNTANFVDVFFTNFQQLLEPGHHPKWKEVNLAAEVPGWRRFPPAEQWLRRNANVASRIDVNELRSMFSRFIESRQQSVGGAGMTQQQRDALFNEFMRWQSGQGR